MLQRRQIEMSTSLLLGACLAVYGCKTRPATSALRDTTYSIDPGELGGVRLFTASDSGAPCVGGVIQPHAVILPLHCARAGVSVKNDTQSIQSQAIVPAVDAVQGDARMQDWTFSSGKDMAVAVFQEDLMSFFGIGSRDLLKMAVSPLLPPSEGQPGDIANVVFAFSGDDAGSFRQVKVTTAGRFAADVVALEPVSVLDSTFNASLTAGGGLVLEQSTNGIAGVVAITRKMQINLELMRQSSSIGINANMQSIVPSGDNTAADPAAKTYIVAADTRSTTGIRMLRTAVSQNGIPNFAGSGIPFKTTKLERGLYSERQGNYCNIVMTPNYEASTVNGVPDALTGISITGQGQGNRQDDCNKFTENFASCDGTRGECYSTDFCERISIDPTGFSLTTTSNPPRVFGYVKQGNQAADPNYVPRVSDPRYRSCGNFSSNLPFRPFCGSNGKKWVIFGNGTTFKDLNNACTGGYVIPSMKDLQTFYSSDEGKKQLGQNQWWTSDLAVGADQANPLAGGMRDFNAGNPSASEYGYTVGSADHLSSYSGICLCDAGAAFNFTKKSAF